MEDQNIEPEQEPKPEEGAAQKIPELAQEAETKKKSPWQFSKIDDHIRSWVFTALILFFSVILIRLIVKEINDDSYHIQAFRMPESLEKDGYDGVTSAYLLMDRVNHMIAIANKTRSIKDLGEYNQSAEKTELHVEISGIGLSPEIISLYIKQALGIKSKTIGGEVVRVNGKGLCMYLRISPGTTEEIYQKIDSSGEVVAYNKLIQKAAEKVLIKNNPLLLGLYFLEERWSDGITADAVDAFREATLQDKSKAADAYAWWAEFLYRTSNNDTTEAMPKIRKALAMDSLNKTATCNLGGMEVFPYEHQIKLLRKAVKLDPTWVTAWNDLGATLLYHDYIKNKEEAIHCFQQCHLLDSTYFVSYHHWGRLLMYHGEFEKANEKLDKALSLRPKHLYGDFFTSGLYYGIAVLVNNQSTFNSFLQQDRMEYFVDGKKITNEQRLGEKLNEVAFDLELHKQYSGAFKILKKALEYDSTSQHADGTLSTMAEIYSLTGDEENFYKYIRKALEVGWKPDLAENCNLDAYKKYCGEPRFQKLLKEFGIKGLQK